MLRVNGGACHGSVDFLSMISEREGPKTIFLHRNLVARTSSYSFSVRVACRHSSAFSELESHLRLSAGFIFGGFTRRL
ncbi:hypothetical protein R1flu_025911 [Riccia fluitans]|uniref:Uncharacterized protein n=1 Tax=Riccia fluitans TaxID=41844 RepID=A0ABD1XZI1_9MARC